MPGLSIGARARAKAFQRRSRLTGWSLKETSPIEDADCGREP
jgi:hypothetical protein